MEEKKPLLFDIEWKCDRCNHRLGLIKREDKNQLRIKYKDLFVSINKALSVTVCCIGCGVDNTLKEENIVERLEVKIQGTVTIKDRKEEYEPGTFTNENGDELLSYIRQI